MVEAPSLRRQDSEPKADLFKSFFNIFISVQGMGLLALPHTWLLGGWVTLLATPTLAALAAHSGCLVAHLSERGSQKALQDIGNGYVDGGSVPAVAPEYADIAHALPLDFEGRRRVQFLLRIFQNVELFAAIALRIVLGGNLLAEAIGREHAGWMITLAYSIPCTATTQLGSISSIADLAQWGTAAMAVVLIVVLVHVCTDAGSEWGEPFATTPLCGQGWITAVGVLLFAYAAHVVVPSVARSMSEPQHFDFLMWYAMLAATFVTLVLGGAMYGALGDLTPEIITAALPSDSWMRVVAALLLACNQIASFPLPVFVLGGRGTQLRARLVRLSIAIGAVALSVAVPQFVRLMSLTGSLTCAVLCYVGPCGCQAWCLLASDSRTEARGRIAFELTVAVLAAAFGIWGTWAGIMEIVHEQLGA